MIAFTIVFALAIAFHIVLVRSSRRADLDHLAEIAARRFATFNAQTMERLNKQMRNMTRRQCIDLVLSTPPDLPSVFKIASQIRRIQ